jgi:centromeric protein E
MFFAPQMVDEKSLIKKYQREISSLKQELDQLRRGVIGGATQDEIMILRQQVCFIYYCG